MGHQLPSDAITLACEPQDIDGKTLELGYCSINDGFNIEDDRLVVPESGMYRITFSGTLCSVDGDLVSVGLRNQDGMVIASAFTDLDFEEGRAAKLEAPASFHAIEYLNAGDTLTLEMRVGNGGSGVQVSS